jgi:hypothetical protein
MEIIICMCATVCGRCVELAAPVQAVSSGALLAENEVSDLRLLHILHQYAVV